MMNIWQGSFPTHNAKEDGYHSLAPVKAFKANSYGIYSTVGNVWEWTADRFTTRNPGEEQWTLKGGSFIDSLDGSFNHKAIVVTRTGNCCDPHGQHRRQRQLQHRLPLCVRQGRWQEASHGSGQAAEARRRGRSRGASRLLGQEW